MIGYDEDIGRAEIDKCADIKAEAEIGDDANEVGDEEEQDELVEPYGLLSLGRGMFILQSGIDYIVVKRGEYRGHWVAHKVRIFGGSIVQRSKTIF